MRHVSTFFAERNNLDMRIHSRRMTRLTNAFKKLENHAHAMPLHFLYYNFVCVGVIAVTKRHSGHQTQWAAQFAVASELGRAAKKG